MECWLRDPAAAQVRLLLAADDRGGRDQHLGDYCNSSNTTNNNRNSNSNSISNSNSNSASLRRSSSSDASHGRLKTIMGCYDFVLAAFQSGTGF